MRVFDAIQIDAPGDVVWAVTVDVERWPEWTPTMTSVSRLDTGPLKVGSIARIKTAKAAGFGMGGDRARGAPEVRLGNPASRSADNRAAHEIVPEGAATRNVVHADTGGAVAWLFWPQLEALYGGFVGEPFTDDSREYVFVARRRTPETY